LSIKNSFSPHYGTGSKPPFEKGLHRIILFAARKKPFKGPYFLIASNAYAEQLGVNRQHEGKNGEIQI
jgi:hypothetical protein